jgi:hypothetical protein
MAEPPILTGPHMGPKNSMDAVDKRKFFVPKKK